MFEAKDFLMVLLGIASGVAANYIFKHIEASLGSIKALEAKLSSKNKTEKTEAARYCLIAAANWYMIANIFWVVAGATWALEEVAIEHGAVMMVLGASSVISIFCFAAALRWVVRAINGYR